jgi:malonate decarboxylase beta subunit
MASWSAKPLLRQRVLLAAQQGEFMGGGVGEVHGAKLTGLLRRAAETRRWRAAAADTGGVRLHEANAGLIAISEIMRATLARALPACRWSR